MSKTHIDEMTKVLNDATKSLTSLSKDQFIPECFKVVLSFGWRSHTFPPVTHRNPVA